MTRCNRVIVIALSAASLGCSAQPEPSADAAEIEMVFWESQSWEAGGGRSRLTLWADGRSEVMVVPGVSFSQSPDTLHPRRGWMMEQGPEGVFFVRPNVFPATIARTKFNQALAAGIHLLEMFAPDYVDGSGTLVGVQSKGELKQTVIPMFLDRHEGSANHRRFLAVSKVLSDFDRQAYDVRD